MTYSETSNNRLITVLFLAVLLTGCTVGPDFKRPATPDVGVYTATELPALGEPQRLVEGGRVNPQWWHEFGSARLDAMVEEALLASPTLAAAQANLRQAREVYAARSGSTLYPQVDASLSGQRQRINLSALGQSDESREFSLYTVGVGVRYTFDLAGGNRRALESLAARVDYQRYQLEGAQLMLAGNIVTTAILRAGLAMQITVTEGILLSQEEHLRVTRERVRLGQAAPDDVLALEIQVEQTRAGIPPLRNRLQQNEHMLAVLAGRAPGTPIPPSLPLEEFTLPVDLPLVVPSELVRTRSDIQAAEALLHAANAEYGVAIAGLYPQINLTANLGTQAVTTGALFGSGSMIWSLMGQLMQPLFNPGLPAEKRAALAVFDAAAANYQNVVLNALRNVADVLHALDNDADHLSALSAASAAAQKSLESMQRRYALGAASYLELLIAQQQSQQTRINLIEAQVQRLVDSAAFYQAMGGGLTNNQAVVKRRSLHE